MKLSRINKNIIIIIQAIIATILAMILAIFLIGILDQSGLKIASNGAFCNILLDISILSSQIVVLIINKQKPILNTIGIKIKNISWAKLITFVLLAFFISFLSFWILIQNKIIYYEGTGFEFYKSNEIIKFVLTLFIQMLFVGVAEEVAFRGMIANYIKRLWGKQSAVIISTLIFTAFHCTVIQSLTQVTDIFVLGLILGIIYIRTDSLLYSMAFHFGIDFATNVSGMKGSKALFLLSSDYSDNDITSRLFGVMSIIGGILIVMFFIIEYFRSKKERYTKMK